MRRRPRTAAAGLLIALGAATMAACGAGNPSAGVLTGRAFGCSRAFPVTVAVYGSRYPGKYAAALERVQDLTGPYSGEPLVASRRTAHGGTYRFTLAPGRYVVDDLAVGSGVLVTVADGQVRRLNFSTVSCLAS